MRGSGLKIHLSPQSAADLACDKARAALLNDSGDAEPGGANASG